MLSAAEASHISLLIKRPFSLEYPALLKAGKQMIQRRPNHFHNQGPQPEPCTTSDLPCAPTGNYGNLAHGSKEEWGQSCWGSLTIPSLQDTAPRQCHMVLALLFFWKSQLLESCDYYFNTLMGFFNLLLVATSIGKHQTPGLKSRKQIQRTQYLLLYNSVLKGDYFLFKQNFSRPWNGGEGSWSVSWRMLMPI